jgi:glycosyl transferase family 25
MEAAFEFLNGWADRILVISLARAADRRARLAERLQGLRYERFEATDNLDLDLGRLRREGVFDERRTPRRFRHTRAMSLAEIACALSHRRIYEETLRNGWERVVVFEDDVIPRNGSLAALPAALAELPAGWDLCYLGYHKNERPSPWDHAKQATYVALGPLRLTRWTPREALRILPTPATPHLRRAGLHTHAHAYAVSRAGAEKLLAAQRPVAFRSDWLFSYLILRGELSAFVTDPQLFDQESASDAGVRSYLHP